MESTERSFKIISPVFNAQRYVERCADSIAYQDYVNYEVMFVDDASSDGTTDILTKVCRKHRFNCMLNSKNRGALYNQVHGIRALDPKPEDVIVFVDGDDRLSHQNVLKHLDYYYEDGIQLAYGQYRPDPPASTCQLAAPHPDSMMEDRSFRKTSATGGGIFWNHLRTVKYEIFSQLTDDDFKDADGNWYQTAADAAIMYPCLELAAPNIRYVDEVLYIYSSDNGLSDWRQRPRQCDKDHMHILGRKPKA